MNALVYFFVAIAANMAPHPLSELPDLDAAEKAALVDLDSAHMNAKVFAAMAMPYKYGVTQMPCKAKEWQPERGWKPAREPAGKVQWIEGPATKVFWAGIYGTCLIQAPKPREALDVIERTALECECNGWSPTH
jgi:hypothetical protein